MRIQQSKSLRNKNYLTKKELIPMSEDEKLYWIEVWERLKNGDIK